MPVLFNKRRPRPALSGSSAGFHPTPSTASLRGMQLLYGGTEY